MIPKIIHYCWFGNNPKPELALKCIDSWRKYCPDYEFIEWNEESFDINCCEYVRDAYKEKKWAFVTDYVRLFALVTYGGIYMDTDVELLGHVDGFLSCSAFSGFQTEDSIPTGIMACEKGYSCFKDLLDEYLTRSFYKDTGEINDIPNTTYITEYFMDKGLVLNNQTQTVSGFTLYPVDYFCAKSWMTGIVTKTDNTVAIHHFAGSWLSKDAQKRSKVKHFCYRHFGRFGNIAYYIYRSFYVITHPRKLKAIIQNRLKKQ